MACIRGRSSYEGIDEILLPKVELMAGGYVDTI